MSSSASIASSTPREITGTNPWQGGCIPTSLVLPVPRNAVTGCVLGCNHRLKPCGLLGRSAEQGAFQPHAWSPPLPLDPERADARLERFWREKDTRFAPLPSIPSSNSTTSKTGIIIHHPFPPRSLKMSDGGGDGGGMGGGVQVSAGLYPKILIGTIASSCVLGFFNPTWNVVRDVPELQSLPYDPRIALAVKYSSTAVSPGLSSFPSLGVS